jgi:hypothetical protein
MFFQNRSVPCFRYNGSVPDPFRVLVIQKKNTITNGEIPKKKSYHKKWGNSKKNHTIKNGEIPTKNRENRTKTKQIFI